MLHNVCVDHCGGGRYEEAYHALCEANAIDRERTVVWAWLAATALRLERGTLALQAARYVLVDDESRSARRVGRAERQPANYLQQDPKGPGTPPWPCTFLWLATGTRAMLRLERKQHHRNRAPAP